MDTVKIFDATLYGGGQAPGAALNLAEKLEVAQLLEQMGVDVIQAGFPSASPRDFKAVQAVAGRVRGSTVCALARAREQDIDVAVAALKDAAHPRIQIGLGVSDSYITGKLKTTREAALEMAVRAVQYARRYVEDVQYYAADAARADVDYLYRVLEAVIAAGARTVNIPDAIGFLAPSEWGALIRGIREHVANIDQAVISVHCHNDLGLAAANTLEALLNGARQAECAVNGIGERTGNAALEEVVMTLHARGETLGLATGVNTRLIYRASQLVSHLTGLPIQPNKALVGAQAFAYTSGMYQDGVLRGRTETEKLDPAALGIVEAEGRIPVLAGRDGLDHYLRELGYALQSDEFERVYARFRVMAQKKPGLEVRDLEAIVKEETTLFMEETYELADVQVTCGINVHPVAAVRLEAPAGERWAVQEGNGPIDAAFKAIDAVVGVPNRLLEFAVQSMTGGEEAIGKVTIRIEGEVPGGDGGEAEKRIIVGHGADTDIIVASARAYVFALNRLLAARQATRRRKGVTEEIRQELEALRARYGTAHTGDFMGYSAMRDEDLF